MKTVFSYFSLCAKKAGKHYIAIFVTTVLLLIVLALTAQMLLTVDQNDASRQRFRIGLTGDLDGVHLGIGFSALTDIDDLAFSIDLLEMDVDEAKRALDRGEISAYVFVPENFISDMVRGKDVRFSVVMQHSTAASPSALISELVKIIAPLITESERGIYAMSEYGRSIGDPRTSQKTAELNLRYIEEILMRAKAIEVDEVGVHSLSMAEYYVCGIATFFFLIFSIACCVLFSDRNLALGRLLRSKNVNVYALVLCEYFAYALIIWFTVFLLATGGAVLSIATDIGFEAGFFFEIAFALLPCVLMLAAMQFLIYEATSGITTGVLAQFMTSVVMGYISGCFYPYYFFPPFLRGIAAKLPSGITFGFLRDRVAGIGTNVWGVCLIYTLLFLVLAVIVRNDRLQRRSS